MTRQGELDPSRVAPTNLVCSKCSRFVLRSMSSMVSSGHHHHHHHHPASSYPYMFHHPPPESLYNHPVSSSPRIPCQPAPAHSVNANTHPAAYPTSTHHASNTSPGATGTGEYEFYFKRAC